MQNTTLKRSVKSEVILIKLLYSMYGFSSDNTLKWTLSIERSPLIFTTGILLLFFDLLNKVITKFILSISWLN